MGSATLHVTRRPRGFFATAPYEIVLDGTGATLVKPDLGITLQGE